MQTFTQGVAMGGGGAFMPGLDAASRSWPQARDASGGNHVGAQPVESPSLGGHSCL
jgi:hypothetical protein